MNTEYYTKKGKKVPVKLILVKRGEGPIDLVDEDWRTFKKFSEANEYLREISRTAPKSGGYDKTDLMVIWADQEIYEGRMDVKRDGSDTNIGEHIKTHLEYRKNHVDAERRKEFQFFLDNYKLHR